MSVSGKRPQRQKGNSKALAGLLGLSALSGLLLFLSDHPIKLWQLQGVALVPWLLGLGWFGSTWLRAGLAGAVTGLTFNLPTALVLEFPLPMAALLGAFLTLFWALMSLGVRSALQRPGWTGALASAAVVVVVEWLDFAVLPVWGTAQTFVRVWTAAPWAIQFASVGGVTAVVFVVVAVQALLASLVREPSCRRGTGLCLGALLLVVALSDWVLWSRQPVRTVKVAAMGWTQQDLARGRATDAAGVLTRFYEPMLRSAARTGARLVVSPETGFVLNARQRPRVLARLGELASTHNVWLAAGYFNLAGDDNRIAFFDRQGQLRGEYRKTHLIPGFERYQAGDGSLVVLEMDGVRLGGMICQDDNFTDLARAYGRQGVQLMVVPTNDWKQVQDHHLENSIFRPLEQRYAMVRAASNGISALVTPRGEVVNRMDHHRAGPGVVTADLPLESGGSLYARLGDWVALSCGLFLAIEVLRRRRGPGP